MLLRELDEVLQQACPESAHAVYAVILAGYPPTMSVRYAGRRGAGVIEKFTKSIANSDLRAQTNAPRNFKETKALFVFIALIEIGTIREFRRAWYRSLEDKVIRVYGRNYSPKEFMQLLPHREIQVQVTIDLDSKEITDVKPSARLEARLSAPQGLKQLMQQASGMNQASRLNAFGLADRW